MTNIKLIEIGLSPSINENGETKIHLSINRGRYLTEEEQKTVETLSEQIVDIVVEGMARGLMFESAEVDNG